MLLRKRNALSAAKLYFKSRLRPVVKDFDSLEDGRTRLGDTLHYYYLGPIENPKVEFSYITA
jgi:hypothetical protein